MLITSQACLFDENINPYIYMLYYFEENNTIACKYREEQDNKMYDNLTTETN